MEKPWLTKDWFILIVAFVGGIKLALSAFFGIEVPQEGIDGVLDMIGAAAMFYGIWKNTHVSKKAKDQMEVLREKGQGLG
ncbi:hypothetical protein [Melghirimyces algeriensis]|uniref:Holin n=1 Tax=Melghirimyces algeriensis TaxID=910412 RepID=A0A521FA58_9BACL|nr:hypothetical protein [Melghirimyces algeriensis]SMO93055.1 hypothetical protein SAMN06264849_11530 [Melghirimyces algeriensis]